MTEAEKKAAAEKGTSTNKTNQGSGGNTGGGSGGTSGGSSGGSSGGGSSGGGSSGGSTGGSNPGGSTGGGTSGGGSSGGNNSGGGSSGGGGTPALFTASVAMPERTGNARIRDKNTVWLSLGLIVTCKNDHTMSTRVTMNAGSGAAVLRWKVNGVIVETETKSINSNTSYTETFQAVITTSNSGNNNITAEVVRVVGETETPVASSTKGVNHSC